MRLETDSIGTLEIPDDAFYGIHSLRSFNNFIKSGEKIDPYLIKAFLLVKKASAQVNFEVGLLASNKYMPIIEAIDVLLNKVDEFCEAGSTELYSDFIVDPYQGGAGTSLNMNVNEVIANTALKLIGKKQGEYQFIHPLDDVNLSQSTNDTYPTALKIASIMLLRELAQAYANLQSALQSKETEFRTIVKLGRTQFQDAAPITLGAEFGAFAQAIARDRWRLYNGEERLRSVNMGGTAIGTSAATNRNYMLKICNVIKNITNLPIAKAEDLIDATQNVDVFVEVHGIVKAGAVSLIKICNDLRLLSSGPTGGIGEINLPKMQAGSSIMPGKVNPVMLEQSIQIAELVKGNDVIVANCAGAGNLELNAFLPLIAHTFLKSLRLLSLSVNDLAGNCILGITANRDKCFEHLINSSASSLLLINKYGYDKVASWVNEAQTQKISFANYLSSNSILSKEELDTYIYKEMGIKK